MSFVKAPRPPARYRRCVDMQGMGLQISPTWASTDRKPPPRPATTSVPRPKSATVAPPPASTKPPVAAAAAAIAADSPPPSKLVGAPSIRERYATPGNAPQAFRYPPTNAAATATPSSAEPSSAADTIAQVVSFVHEAVKKDAGNSKGGAIHLHLHAPVHIHFAKL